MNTVMIMITVDISKCGFSKVPVIATSMEGVGGHGTLAGSSSVQGAEATLFHILIYDQYSGLDKKQAEDDLWNIEWIAVGYMC